MKRLSVLLSILLLVLSCIPCTDDAADAASGSVLAFTKADAHPHTPQTDFCSPLCICSCCGGVIVHFFSTELMRFASFTQIARAIYTPSFTGLPLFSIWQPPKWVA